MNEDKMKFGKTVCSVRTMPVIEIMASVGSNRENDPKRIVVQYWDLKGNLLAVNDPIKEIHS